jgi:ketosteroid isomerase-like protein
MHPNAQLLQSFYTAFQNMDAEGMKKCYHPDVHFSDPAFPDLKGEQVSAMWSMLVENLKKGKGGWKLEFSNIKADDITGSAHWEAHYTLSSTGNRVHNIIDARFQFQDGKIIRHVDSFDFYRWARMGFGFKGTLLGWAPFFKKKVQATVKNLLIKYMERAKA